LGVIEGVAESTASLLKVFSGIWTDSLKHRKPLVLWGYGLSSFFRPFIGLAGSWPMVLLFRFIDRVGKGIRTSPRDALIADAATPSNRGLLYGFHSSMDNAGALIGPFLASGLLYFAGLGLRNIIFFSLIPGLAACLCLLAIKERTAKASLKTKTLDFRGDWKKLSGEFKFLLLVLLLFTLGNSTDAFLLIRLSQVGVSAAFIPLMWGLHSGVRMLASSFGGRLSDRLGRKPVILSGWIYYALIYLAFAQVSQKEAVIAVFLAYGIFHGLCEPSEKAFVADFAPAALRGTAFGYYNLVVGLFALPASLLFGFVGQTWGYPSAFMVGASLAGLASLLLIFVRKP
jgi:MFS family permease